MGRPPVLPKHLIFSRQKKEAKIVAMSSSIVILLGLLAAASAMSPHKDCGSKGTITGLDINGCTRPPCLLPKGSDAAMPFNVPEGKACETGHVKPGCPLTPGQEHTYDIK